MHILVFANACILVLPEAVEKVAETHDDLITVVKVGVADGGGVNSEEEHVDRQVSGRQERRGVLGVLGPIKQRPIIDHAGDVVQRAGIVEDTVRVDGQIGSVVHVGVPHSGDDDGGDACSDELVQSREEWNHQWVGGVEEEDVPIKGWPWVDAETVVEPRYGREVKVVGGDPRQPGEDTQSVEDVLWEPEIHKHGSKGDAKEPVQD